MKFETVWATDTGRRKIPLRETKSDLEELREVVKRGVEYKSTGG
jgi:hypothetical protein